MQCELVFTGSELLLGDVSNTHAVYLGHELAKLGIEVILQTTVGDDWTLMEQVVRGALERADLVVTTGGLGPTTDDITKDVVASVLGVPMVTDAESLEQMRKFFARRGTEMPSICARQARFPEGSRVLPNHKGTAPGALIEDKGKIIIILPGPPRELRAMFETSVRPYLLEIPGRGEVLRTRVLKLTGIPEYTVQEKLKDLGGPGNPGLGYLTKPGEVQVRVSAHAVDPAAAERLVEELAGRITGLVGEYVFAVDDEAPERTVGDMLFGRGLTISVAESCTAGMVAARFTDVPGSSRYFCGGVVVYNNDLKRQLVGVPNEILERYGAVSENTAVAMAEGIRRIAGSDLGLAITGIAGPEGGTLVKPVGLVYVALASDQGTQCHRLILPGVRSAVRMGTVNAAFKILKDSLSAKAPAVEEPLQDTGAP
ncbi:MAG: competence/damage-inducible protein A [Candidatus Desulforudis sp.]|nr:competence/damage-inducible protein A [Desulforudis sp.]